ncbi:hypothetical protein HDV05_000541 [Chytridiales sp. JEL 0842]|nr:hypothetical protein HDV05_000541 [Chytridiales sp. JEL 0842]
MTTNSQCERCIELEAELEETRREFDDFQTDSRELESELEKEITDLKQRYKSLESTFEEFRSKHLSSQDQCNKTIESLQAELTNLRQSDATYQNVVRELEISNSELEQMVRIGEASAADWQTKYDKQLEINSMLAMEVEAKEELAFENQRLRDELRALNEIPKWNFQFTNPKPKPSLQAAPHKMDTQPWTNYFHEPNLLNSESKLLKTNTLNL